MADDNYICNKYGYTGHLKQEYGKHFILILESDTERIRIKIA